MKHCGRIGSGQIPQLAAAEQSERRGCCPWPADFESNTCFTVPQRATSMAWHVNSTHLQGNARGRAVEGGIGCQVTHGIDDALEGGTLLESGLKHVDSFGQLQTRARCCEITVAYAMASGVR